MSEPEIKEVDGMEGKLCHIDKEPCIGQKCGQYRFITGVHFQDGTPIRRWDCAMANTQLMQGEQSAYAKEVRDEVHALKVNMRAMAEAILEAAGRQNILVRMDARLNHQNALTRTEELRERNKTPNKSDVQTEH